MKKEHRTKGLGLGTLDLEGQDRRKKFLSWSLSFLLSLLFFLNSIFFSRFSAFGSWLPDSASDYDSLIVEPTERVIKANRMNRVMQRYRVLRFQKIKDNLYVIPLSEQEDKELKIKELKLSNQFKLIEPDYKLYTDNKNSGRNFIKIIKHPDSIEPLNNNEVTPNDKDFTSQYYLKQINATKAWRTTTGSSLLVGVLDTGVDATHPDLIGKVTASDGSEEDLADDIGHGTEVAGIIAANTNNKQGIAGISWGTKVLSLKVTDSLGQARISTVAQALDKAYASGVKIVQISLSTNQFSQTFRNVIKEAQDRGILIISTSGNTGIQELRYPAAFSGVIGVGAVDQNKKKESYSTTGDHVTLVAPGTSIFTTSLDSSYDSVTGTSFAAPQVAGAAALVWSIAPDLRSDEVREILTESADDLGTLGKDKLYGYGLLNTEKAVELAKEKITDAQN